MSSVSHSLASLLAATSVILSLFVSGCARGPFGGAAGTALRRLVVRINVAGRIDDRLFYFVAFDDNDDPSDGPLPVVSAPFGNGWGTGSFQTFVRYHQGIYQTFTHMANPGGFVIDTAVDRPLISVPPTGNQLEFTLDMDQTFRMGARNLDINILATDQILVDPNLQAIKQEDSIGPPPGTDYITIPIDRNGTFDNRIVLEPTGDVVNQDIDISDFRIEVQLP